MRLRRRPLDVMLAGPAFESSIEPMLMLDPHADRILDANPAACTLLGYPRRCCGRPVSALHPGQLPALIVFTQAVLERARGGPTR